MTSLTDRALENAYLNELLHAYDQDVLRKHVAQPARLEPADCVALENRRILAKVYDLCSEKQEVSPLTVITALEREGHGTAATATAALSEKYEPRMDSFGSMSSRLRELARARRIDALLRKAQEAAQSLNLEAAEEYAREVVGEAPDARQEAESLRSAARHAAYASQATGPTKIIRSGFPLIDSVIGGLRPGSLWTIGGRTGAGKSSLMLSVAIDMAKRGYRPGIVSCEDDRTVWGERALAHTEGLRREALQAPVRDFALNARCDRGIEKLREDGVQLDYVFNRPLANVLASVRNLISNKRCDVIMIDYLQAIAFGSGAELHKLVSAATRCGEGRACD